MNSAIHYQVTVSLLAPERENGQWRVERAIHHAGREKQVLETFKGTEAQCRARLGDVVAHYEKNGEKGQWTVT